MIQVENFLQHQWAYRVWTFQEVILCRNPVVLSGESSVLWEDLVNAIILQDPLPTMATALAHWYSLVILWLVFPHRPHLTQKSPDLHNEGSKDTHSFNQRVHTICSHNIFHNPCAFWLYIALLLICITSIGFALRELDRASPGALVPVVWITIIGAPYIWINYVDPLLTFVLFGRKHELPVPATDTKDEVGVRTDLLDGIWNTLRARICSEPRDRYFALSGILKRSGVLVPAPDYSLTIEEIYRTLFRDLLQWQPAALTLILDAGISDLEPGWPSWLPNWATARHNTWLVDRCCLEKKENVTPIEKSDSPTISGANLTLRGKQFGEVKSCFYLSAIPDEDNHAQLISGLDSLTQWIRSAGVSPLNMSSFIQREITLFATLEGLMPKKRDTTYPGSQWSHKERRRKLFVRHRSALQAPYDVTPYMHKFDAFKEFYAIVDKSPDKVGEEILASIQGNRTAFDYFVRITNTLARERRCLFVLFGFRAGSGPLEMANHDDVFLLPGVRAPVALRRQRERSALTFVGPVLIHGLMYGEEFGYKSGYTQELVLE